MQEPSESFSDLGEFAPAKVPLSPRRFLEGVRRFWWIPLLAAVIPSTAAFFYVRKQPVQYVARATAWVRGKLKISEMGQYSEDVQNFFGTQIQLLQSDTMQERTLARLKSSNPEVDVLQIESGKVQVPRIRVSQAPKSSVFVLESTSTSGRLARAYLDALLDEFLAYKKEIRKATSGDALASVSSQVYKQELELKGEHQKLERFQRENNVALLEENLRGGGAQLAQMNAQISMLKLELQLLNASAVEKSAGIDGQKNEATTNAVAAAAPVTTSPAGPQQHYAGAQQQLELLLIQHEQLSRYLRPKHPKMIKLTEEIAKSEKIFAFYVEQNQRQVSASTEATRIRLRSLESAAAELAQKVSDANKKMAELESIKAGIARQQTFYEKLLTLLQGVDLNSSMTQEDVAILERAGNARAVRPQRVLVVGGGGAAGFLAGLGIIFLLVRLDDRCDSLIDLKAQFPEPVFGQLPDLEGKGEEAGLPVLRLNDNRHIFVESCRSLRSSLLFGNLSKDPPKIILVTSAAPNEGKSTVSVNLATTLAQGGLRVLLMDADLRRGSLHRLLGLSVKEGLSDCIISGRNPDEFVVSSSVPGLFVLPRGGVSAGGSELFLSRRFDELLARVRALYDFVIMDSIPVFAADDTTTLAPKVDGVLFVIRRAQTSAKLAQSALELLYQRQARILGIVFNAADSAARSYGYYKYSSYDVHSDAIGRS